MQIRFNFSRDFLKDVRRLRKRYRFIEEDIDSLKEEMRHKGYRGVLLSGYEAPIYKVRLANRSARRGKSGGFRAMYIFLDNDTILFVHIYSKSDKAGVTAGEVGRILSDLNV